MVPDPYNWMTSSHLSVRNQNRNVHGAAMNKIYTQLYSNWTGSTALQTPTVRVLVYPRQLLNCFDQVINSCFSLHTTTVIDLQTLSKRIATELSESCRLMYAAYSKWITLIIVIVTNLQALHHFLHLVSTKIQEALYEITVYETKTRFRLSFCVERTPTGCWLRYTRTTWKDTIS